PPASLQVGADPAMTGSTRWMPAMLMGDPGLNWVGRSRPLADHAPAEPGNFASFVQRLSDQGDAESRDQRIQRRIDEEIDADTERALEENAQGSQPGPADKTFDLWTDLRNREVDARNRATNEETQQQMFNWMAQGGANGNAPAPLIRGPDGKLYTAVFWIGDQAYTWKMNGDGRWDVVALIRPSDVTPAEWREQGITQLGSAGTRAISEPAERAAINGALGYITQIQSENWVREHLPKELAEELIRTGAIVAILSDHADALLEAEKMLWEGKSEDEVRKFLMKEGVKTASINSAFGVLGVVVGAAARKLAKSGLFKRLLEKGDEVAWQIKNKLDELLQLSGKGANMTDGDRRALQAGLEDLRELGEKSSGQVKKDVQALVKESEAALGKHADEAAEQLEEGADKVKDKLDLRGRSSGGKEHTGEARGSTTEIHQRGRDRKRMDYGGEKGDESRGYPRKPPTGKKGKWPPQQ
ncbi:MAG TPA: hypothetical protein VFW40_13415, partial [Capsulimonadaceae bacterium]|nr:hypothetical protein [Capsulimonadaceae bacterium]